MRRFTRRRAGRLLLRISRRAFKESVAVLRGTELTPEESRLWNNAALLFCWLPAFLAADKPVKRLYDGDTCPVCKRPLGGCTGMCFGAGVDVDCDRISEYARLLEEDRVRCAAPRAADPTDPLSDRFVSLYYWQGHSLLCAMMLGDGLNTAGLGKRLRCERCIENETYFARCEDVARVRTIDDWPTRDAAAAQEDGRS